jgi:rod shape determining protein RodA
MKSKTVFTLDIVLILSTIALVVIGILFIYSSGISSTGILFSREHIRQIIWAGTGFILLFLIALLDYERFKMMALYIYGFFILLLVITLLFGEVVNGARSWLGILNVGIQPSEFAKISTVLLLAAYYSSVGKRIDTFLHFIIGFIITCIPVCLILLQPDMGTAFVFIPVFLVVSYFAGARLRYIVFVIATGIIFIAFSILPYIPSVLQVDGANWITELFLNRSVILYGLLILLFVSGAAFAGFQFFKKGYFYWIFYTGFILFFGIAGAFGTGLFLKDYQIKRLIIFLNPETDPQGAGWNIIQSITAVGSGGLTGKGFLQGTQSHYQYLPQQSTDFIFSILAEEWGFIGVLAVFLLYIVILVRATLVLFSIKNRFAVYLGSGIIGILLLHFIINIGMAVGIMPITGIPLVFLSYGGSSLWTGLIGIGFLLSIYRKKETF